MPLYELRRIVHRYNGKTSLELAHYPIETGAIVGLKGPNGSGKSTLLNLLGFVHPPTCGDILFKGHPAEPFSAGIRHQVSLLPQQAYLLRRTVHENIAYGLRLRARNGRERHRRIHEALDLVGLSVQDFGPRPWFALSGGEARRVALAARLALHPEVLLLDEPTASVDDASTRNIKTAIEYAHRQWATTLIIASHDEAWLEDICDTRLHLYRGRSLGGNPITPIYGPWAKHESGRVIRQLGRQQFHAPGAPQPEAVAVLKAAQMILHPTRPAHDPDRHCLEGRVVNLSFDRTSNGIKVSVNVDELTFPVILESHAVSTGTCLPGRIVWLSYALADVQWHQV